MNNPRPFPIPPPLPVYVCVENSTCKLFCLLLRSYFSWCVLCHMPKFQKIKLWSTQAHCANRETYVSVLCSRVVHGMQAQMLTVMELPCMRRPLLSSSHRCQLPSRLETLHSFVLMMFDWNLHVVVLFFISLICTVAPLSRLLLPPKVLEKQM